ncbi:hypothetical protein Cgig2_014549 [Carnegiea gigantea]|uniref:Small-subunit processome Utp12 domain-containing protein n=1 Tax=Carnegiea gigantea TaxID=171969 RepID=A0A9Q1KXS7_9CARY|nr:hypothetical protein Cgig2_014549 [Carnegiea gigantea]
MGSSHLALEASVEKHSKKKSRKKRGAPEPDASITENMAYARCKLTIAALHTVDGEDAYETEVEGNEPTMADKLASLDAVVIDNADVDERQDPSQTAPPSADPVHILLKQALHADDRALLLDSLYNRDDKVIANSVIQLNPIDVFKLLDSLISIIQSRHHLQASADHESPMISSKFVSVICRLSILSILNLLYAVLLQGCSSGVCTSMAKKLLVLHSSRIMSQESSLITLSSLYQLIESRLGTLSPALQLASSVDFLYSGVEDDGLDEYESAPPVIYEDNAESEEVESGDDVMDTDEDDNELEELSGISDVDALEGLAN